MTASSRDAGKSLMSRAVALLSRREHSRIELARKLRRHLEPDDDPGEIDRVLDALVAQKLLSDQRFAASLVRQRSQRYGDLRVERDLRDRGVDASEANAAMRALHGTELARAHAVWTRRFDALPTSAKERGRQGRYLQTRGFSMEAIQAVLAGKRPDDA
jgi:regulatory protein